MKIAFTGTQEGILQPQGTALAYQLKKYKDSIFMHGDCIGADAQAHALAQAFGMEIHIFPPKKEDKRAFCPGAAVVHQPYPYLMRNRMMVNEAKLLIACPRSRMEEIRSGTWSTVRYARRKGLKIIKIFPNGEQEVENA